VRKQQVMDRSRVGEKRDRASSGSAWAPARSTRICSSVSTERSRSIGGFRARVIATPSGNHRLYIMLAALELGSLFILYIQGYGFGRVMDSNDFRTVE
jgi:hypothetical protein